MSEATQTEIKSQIPIGQGEKIAEQVKRNPRERLVIFSQVRNKVIRVNNSIQAPFKLAEGKKSNLGMFAEKGFIDLNDSERSSIFYPQKEQYLGEYWHGHRRSTIIGRVLFRDNEGRIYRDVDLKGIGLLSLSRDNIDFVVGTTVKSIGTGLERDMGLLNLDEAEKDYEKSEEFLRAGIRTNRIIAIIKLDELILSGRKISIEEAIKNDIIQPGFIPVIEVRAFATRARLVDFIELQNQEVRRILIDDAKKLVAQELGKKEPLSDQEYIDWLIDTLGHNVGSMHKNGWFHGNLRTQNITLDGRIVDLATVKNLEFENQRVEDIEFVNLGLREFIEKLLGKDWLSVKFLEEAERIREKFMDAYNSVYASKE